MILIVHSLESLYCIPMPVAMETPCVSSCHTEEENWSKLVTGYVMELGLLNNIEQTGHSSSWFILHWHSDRDSQRQSPKKKHNSSSLKTVSVLYMTSKFPIVTPRDSDSTTSLRSPREFRCTQRRPGQVEVVSPRQVGAGLEWQCHCQLLN